MSLQNFFEQILKSALQSAIPLVLDESIQRLLHSDSKPILEQLRNQLDEHLKNTN